MIISTINRSNPIHPYRLSLTLGHEASHNDLILETHHLGLWLTMVDSDRVMLNYWLTSGNLMVNRCLITG